MSSAVTPLRMPLIWKQPVQEKSFCLLSTIAESAELRKLLPADIHLKQLAVARRHALASATGSRLAKDAVAPARWSPAEIADVELALKELCKQHAPEMTALAGSLRERGMLIREAALADDELIAFAWKREALAMNRILDVYGNGLPPAYPAIDSISFDPASPEWAFKVAAVIATATTGHEQNLFFEDSLQIAMGLLALNERDEAGRFEPMSEKENKPALERIGKIHWQKYSYSCILVPGIGPEVTDQALSSGGRANAELAAEKFKTGLAPLIIVSGGYVHPNKTRFCEAVEMRRELIDKLGVPADAVIIEPHARHTTTNIRNAARLVYRYGIPFDKPALVTSNPAQIGTIASRAFANRCQKELGYQPAQIGKTLSAKELELRWNIDSLEADPNAPLDP